MDIELETEQLYQDLANMSLSERNNNNNNIDDPSSLDPSLFSDIPVGTDGLPFYLWCQPCDVIGREEDYYYDKPEVEDNQTTSANDEFQPLDPTLPPITEDQPLDSVESEIVRRSQEQHVRDLQELYMLSQRQHHPSIEEEEEEDQPGIMKLDNTDPLLQELQHQMEAKESQSWWNAAQQWTQAFGVDLIDKNTTRDESDKESTIPRPSKNTLKSCIGHKETIYGVCFSPDEKYMATASQDSTIKIWETSTQRLLTSLKGHSTDYECLRVDWASINWADEVLDRSERFSSIVASAGADGILKVWACKDPKNGSEWECEYTLDHAELLGRGVKKTKDKSEEEKNPHNESEDDEEEAVEIDGDKPQIYALQFIDHWKVFTKNLQQHCHRHQKEEEQKSASQQDEKPSDDGIKNSFLMTSSDEFIHLWEVVGHPFDQQLMLEDHKIRLLQDNEIKLKEVMTLHFGNLEQYGYGVTPCSITGQGLNLPPPPQVDQNQQQNTAGNAFGGERNPQKIVYVFDADYCPANGLLGVALSDGSLRLVNGRGICISVLNLPGNQSHLTSFCWDSTGNRIATCVATGHLITWNLDSDSHQGGNYNTVATCSAIFEGGHQSGRPLFGSRILWSG